MKTQLIIHPEELSREWIRRAVSLGVDVLGLHPVGGSRAKESMTALLAQLKTPAFRALLDEAAESGLEIEYELHAGSFLVPQDLFSEHPEYYRENENGERTADYNFCPSSPEMLDTVVRNAVSVAKQLYRSTHRYYFWLDDTKNGDCRCARCRALTPSDQQLLIMNRILAGLRQFDPEAKLAYLAYFNCLRPPAKVTPDSGIFLEYAPFERKSTVPAREQTVEEELEPLLTVFPASDAKILEYWYDNSMYSGWKKPTKRFVADNALIRDDLAFYRQKGLTYLSSFACYLGRDYTALYGEPDLSAFAK